MKMNIIINLQFEALHNWSTIPKEHSQQYLKQSHRHVFHCKIKIPVTHTNRNIEFIDHKHKILEDLKMAFSVHKTIGMSNLGSASCEDLAQYFIDSWDAVYASVLEDGENGAEVYTNAYFEVTEPHVTGDFI